MSIACTVCNQFHDHNIMEHIYELENHLHALLERVATLERKATDSDKDTDRRANHQAESELAK